MFIYIILLGLATIVLFGFIAIAAMFRRVVGANGVHIIQKSNKNLSYGAQTANGSVYYAIPSWIPIWG